MCVGSSGLKRPGSVDSFHQETLQASATVGRTHKSHFSVTSLLGTQQSPGGRDRFSSKTGQSDPMASPRPGSIRGSFGSQEPRTIPLAGASGALTLPKRHALEAPDPKEELRNSSSSISLKLKMPKFKSIGRPKTADRGETRSPISSPRPQSPLLLGPPVVGLRPGLSNDTFALGALQFNTPSPRSSYLIPNELPSSDGDRTPTSSSLPLSAASTMIMLAHEDSMPPTPNTLRSGIFRPGSPSISEPLPSQRDEANLKHTAFLCDGVPSAVIRSAEFLKSRIRPFPTITQDDMSLDLQTLAEKRKSLNRISRRASVSSTSMLSSPSSPPSKPLSSSFHVDGDDNNHRCPAQSSNALTEAGCTQDEATSPLSPLTFERVPSPHLNPNTIPSSEPATPRTSSTPSHHDDNDSVHTPTAATHPDMPFSSIVDTPSSSSCHTTTSNHSHPASQTTSLKGGSRGATPEAPLQSYAPRSGADFSVAHVEKWEEERERVTRDITVLYAGEACIIRYEPKQRWLGVWNRSNIKDVIEGLRELRSPKT